jgi:RNA polymerase sigma-70 factor (ECF subfamily)
MAIEARLRGLVAAGEVDTAATLALRAVRPRVTRYLRSVLHDECDAADAYSAFTESLWRGLPAFRADASLLTWAFRLARNAALDLKKEAWRRRARRLETRDASRLAAAGTPSAAVAEQRRHRLDHLRASLSEEERSLLALRVDQGLSWSAVAAVLDGEGRPVDATTLMKRYERLKDRLGRLAKEQGFLE